jgi:hypothetical protein
LLLFVVTSDSRRFAHWELTGELQLTQLAFIALYVAVAHQTSPTLFDSQRFISFSSAVLVVQMLYDDLNLFEFLFKIAESFLETVPIGFFVNVHLQSIYLSHYLLSDGC